MPRQSSFNISLRFGKSGVSWRPYFVGRAGSLLGILFGKRHRIKL